MEEQEQVKEQNPDDVRVHITQMLCRGVSGKLFKGETP